MPQSTDQAHFFDRPMQTYGIDTMKEFTDEQRVACRFICDDSFNLGRKQQEGEYQPFNLPQLTPDRQDNWKHRSKNMTCATCMKFVHKDGFENGEIVFGRCRHNAPTHDGWPAVYGSDWCFQHKLDENKIK